MGTLRRGFVLVAAIAGMLATTIAPAGAIYDLETPAGIDADIPDNLIPDYLVRLDMSGGGRCSGSLVDAEFVVTAAHCVVVSGGEDTICGGTRQARIRQANEFTATIGGQEIRRGVKEIAVHPGYTLNNPASINDIAVLWLDQPVPVSYTTLKVEPLPSRSASYSLRSYGYGHHEQNTCEGQLDNEPRQVAHDSRPLTHAGLYDLCAGNLCTEIGRDAGAVVCRGDSGGPTVRNGDTLVALLQRTIGSNNGCALSWRETVHTYAGTHEAFIKTSIAVRICPSELSQFGGAVRMLSWGEFPSSGSDVVIGTHNSEEINGFGGDDVLCGRGGHDTIYGHAGNDFLVGGSGNDDIFGGDGEDRIHGSTGTDDLFGGNHNDIISGGDHADVIEGGAGSDFISGDSGSDVIQGGSGEDTIDGGEGNDTLRAGKGDDTIWGGFGADKLYGGNDDDVLRGEDGDDIVYGGRGRDGLYGGNGNDRLLGGIGTDVTNGGSGTADYCRSGTKSGCER